MDETLSLLSEGVEITGEISFTNALRVDGFIKGKIQSDSYLIIGSAGKVNADINVHRISVSGEFHGTIRAHDRVEIHRDGKVYGDIYSPCLIIEAGAIFEGRCNMSDSSISKEREDTLPKAVDADPGISS